ncbi:MAG: TrkH family potassium uptake protein [Planctomycetaceae bacterium]|nr:TrkH family potassium uptake protein [Planctomycetaceae bacterium]MCB9937007.1 TrkH family potassium uptake protein [Planctomycetaceae bacterium]
MVFSLPWAHPALGHRVGGDIVEFVEVHGFLSLVASMLISFFVGWLLIRYGRGTEIRLYRKEAMAVVGLSWILATVLGALPFWLRGTYRGPSVRLATDNVTWQVYDSENYLWRHWDTKGTLPAAQDSVVQSLYDAGAKGIALDELTEASGAVHPSELLEELRRSDRDWGEAIIFPGEEEEIDGRSERFRLRWIKMGIADALFESQSGFSTTGATVISDLEDPVLVPHCLLFWRSSTHFLGGLGIIVLFVAILGQGSAGKAMMRAEMPGPSKDGMQARMQQTAWVFAAIYCVLNLVLTIILCFQGLSVFDALCHAFGTMATGGFSTWNKSLGHFDSAWIEYTVTIFMIIAGTNFTLLYFVAFGQFRRLFDDVEFRAYLAVIAGVTLLIVVTGMRHSDFDGVSSAFRYGLFQVVAIITTTGFGTHDFDQWSSFGRGVLFLLMFVGGCAGSTGGGLKVIRHILFLKIMRLEIEQAFHPTVVRPLRLGGKSVDDPDLRKNILVYFGLILVIFVFSWIFVVAVEPDATWGTNIEHKLIDSASGVASTLNNIGPGLGTVGATQNYGHFSPLSKFLFVWLMMIGRIEIFAILVLFMPSFWRNR